MSNMAAVSPAVQCISPYTFLLEFKKDRKSLTCHLIYSYDPGASQLRTTFYSTHKNLNYSREQKWAELVERYRIDKASKTGYICDIEKENAHRHIGRHSREHAVSNCVPTSDASDLNSQESQLLT